MKISCMKIMSRSQYRALSNSTLGEEGKYFSDLLLDVHKQVNAVPAIRCQEKLGKNAVIYLHYFKNNMDWYITEIDHNLFQEEGVVEGFGLADLGYSEPGLGYISITELVQNGVELDLHWEQKTLLDVAPGL